MSEVMDFYKKQAKEEFSKLPWLAELQTQGLQALEKQGFPSRHVEDWKYTILEGFLQQRFVLAGKEKTTYQSKLPLFSELNLTIQDGQVFGEQTLKAHLKPKLIIQSLETAVLHHAELLKPFLGQVLKHEHGFQALNTAMLGCGVVIYIPAGLQVEQPIVLYHRQNKEEQAVHNRYLIIAEEGSEATIIEHYEGLEGCTYLSNTVTEVFMGKNARLHHYKIQKESKSAYHIGQLSVKQTKNSQFNSHSLSLGGKLVRSDTNLYLEEEEAGCLLNGIYAPDEGQHIDHHTQVHHLVGNCRSEQDYKGILRGRSRAVFNGKVIVAKNAQHTEAQQQNKNLLLSPQAEINTKPQLEIFADDVICTHGATVGQLDEEALFYLATRGIDKQEASSYLIHAFAANNLRLIPNKNLADWMLHLINEQLR